MRKICVLTTALILLLVFAGCGVQAPNTDAVTTPPAVTTENEPAPGSTSADEAVTTLPTIFVDEPVPVPGGTSADEAFDITVSYANYTGDDRIYTSALNTQKIYTYISSVRHLPVYRFDTLSELERFKENFGNVLTMDRGYDEIPSFREVTAKYDNTFFAENTLMLVYVTASSGSYRYGVESVFCDGQTLSVQVEQSNRSSIGTAVTCDMAGWFVTVAVPDSMAAGCAEFDAALVG
ncbi:MAG: hypothetical protein E7654_02865 [Ruminococcaceae bacterium]|nr:hypothetical protein [Oscillospiraceae bacterium]